MKELIVAMLMIYFTVSAFADSKAFTDADLDKYKSEGSSLSTDESTPKNAVRDEDKVRAYNICIHAVRISLKTPSMANFTPIADVSIENAVSYEGGIYKVFGSVDSQNSYGAMLRKNFICEVYKEASGQMRVQRKDLF